MTSADFTLAEAQSVLATLRDVAIDELQRPFSRADVATILAAGAEVKSVQDGLLDFPCEVEGVLAYWCWQAGEPEIGWWHPRDTGFAGRRPIRP